MTKKKDILITARCLGDLTHLDCENCGHKKNPINLTEIVKGKRIPLTIDRLKKLISEGKDTKEWASNCYLRQQILLNETVQDSTGHPFIVLQPTTEPLGSLRIAVMATD